MVRKINIVFWTLWLFALCLGLIEAITYSGFVVKHFGFNPLMVVAGAGFLGILVLFLRFKHKDLKEQKGERTIVIFFIFLLILYVVLKVAQWLTYPNFVFGKLHVQPNNLLLPVLISFLSVAVIWIPRIPRINFKKLFTVPYTLLLFVSAVIVFNFFRIYKIEQWAFQFVITHPTASYDDKMRRTIEPLFYNYTMFINKYTSPNSSFLIPPQSFPWPQSGNVPYLRYFIYPRELENGEESVSPSKEALRNIDYILLTWGETDTTQGEYTHSWPKFDVAAEKIIFMNEDGTFGGEVRGNYHYKEYLGKKVWGLIKIKH